VRHKVLNGLTNQLFRLEWHDLQLEEVVRVQVVERLTEQLLLELLLLEFQIKVMLHLSLVWLLDARLQLRSCEILSSGKKILLHNTTYLLLHFSYKCFLVCPERE
jgi:hypothetical protein